MDHKYISTPPPTVNILSLLPPEIRTEIYTHYLNNYFRAFPFKREIIYQATDAKAWNFDWRINPDVCDLPPLERALSGDRIFYREFFTVRVSLSVVVIRPAECSDYSIFHSGSDTLLGCILEATERNHIRYPVLGLHISPLVVKNAREIRYLT